MWRLVELNEDGTHGNVFRDDYKDQWEALRTAIKKDGSHYKKKEALEIENGSIVIRQVFEKTVQSFNKIRSDGMLDTKTYSKTLMIPKNNRFILEEYS